MVETNMNFTSVFDLSPTEKLQLVEDLWDDLAATPESVPIHDWQKQELARRKANLLIIPLPAFLGKKSNNGYAVVMADKLIIALEVEEDLSEAYVWARAYTAVSIFDLL